MNLTDEIKKLQSEADVLEKQSDEAWWQCKVKRAKAIKLQKLLEKVNEELNGNQEKEAPLGTNK